MLMIPCDLILPAGQPPVALMAAFIRAGDLADTVRRVGVGVSVAGAFEAAPEVIARAWRRVRQGGRWLRGRLARWVPWLRGEPVTVDLPTANVDIRAPKSG